MKGFLYSFFFFITVKCPSQGFWTQKADFPGTARYDAFSFSIGDTGYLGAGADGTATTKFNDFWKYDPFNNTWTTKSFFAGTARWQAVAFSIGTKGYVGTGQDINFNNDLWEYDPASDLWTQKASMPTFTRNNAVGFSIGNKGYIGTGRGGNPSTEHNDFWEYDPSLNSWTQKSNLPGYKRSFATGLSIGAKGYVGTGVSNGVNLSDFWEYDPVSDSWAQKANFPGGARHDIDGAHFTIGSYGYIGTGRNTVYGSWVHYNDFWKYNPSNDTWIQIPALPATGRIGASSFSLDNKGYIGLGYNVSSVSLNDLWEYSPIDSCSSPIAKFNFTASAQKIYFNNLTDELCSYCSWQWNFGDGNTSAGENPIHTYDTVGSYLVTFITCEDTCCDTMAVTIIVSAVSVEEAANKKKGKLYQNIPNPFSDETTIHYFLPEMASDAEIVLYDNSGKTIEVILLQNKGNGSVTIDLSKLASGAYSYSLIVDGKLADTKRMAKNK